VFEIKIADKDLWSHLYLSDLVGQQGLIDFTLIDGSLCRPKTLTGEQQSAFEFNVSHLQSTFSKLVIFTEGLHLQQLTQVTQALADYLDLVF
jgi:phosphoserine phosphatase